MIVRVGEARYSYCQICEMNIPRSLFEAQNSQVRGFMVR